MASNLSNLDVIYEDNHLIIINKKVGDIVQGDKTGDTPLSEIVKQYLKEKYQKPGKVFLGVVHRLDRPTSGIIIFARTSKALERLNKMFREKQLKKTYWAIVKNKPNKEKGTLINYLKKNPKNNKTTVYKEEAIGSKRAVLHYKIIQVLMTYYLLEIILETGRHHQIRAQLSAMGSPIKGDLKYGFDRSNKGGGIHLHARNIEFIHPVSKETIKLVASLPEDTVWSSCE
ncbi:MAG: RNA pseudouridine synthase [Flavobacteriaceae bacterium]|nr:RNA pseudouridine synthase [Flavobacteriaceae bacterium]